MGERMETGPFDLGTGPGTLLAERKRGRTPGNGVFLLLVLT